jgi:uncharacterized protein YkwD
MIMLSGVLSAQTPYTGSPSPEMAPWISDPNVLQEELLRLVNQYRFEHGREPLKLDRRLSIIASKHAATMTATGWVFSDEVTGRWLEASQGNRRIIRYAENQAFAWPVKEVPGNVLQSWARRQRFNRNLIERDFTLTGIGISLDRNGNVFVAQNFAQERPIISGKKDMEDDAAPASSEATSTPASEPQMTAPPTVPSVIDLQ